MSDRLAVDPSALERMSAEFDRTADSLRHTVSTFQARGGAPAVAYGSLPTAHAAASEHAATADQAVRHLSTLATELTGIARDLRAHASDWRRTEDDAVGHAGWH